MTVPGNLSSPLLATAAEAAAAAAGPIKSLRFNSGDSAYLSKTFSSAGNRKTFTFSCWVKKAVLGVSQVLLDQRGGSPQSDSNLGVFYLKSDNTLEFSGGVNIFRQTTRVLRDLSAWYHVVLACDTTLATADDRVKVYVNGVEETDFANSATISQNFEFSINQAALHGIGATSLTSPSAFLDGYLADIYFIDGSQLDPTSFGAYDDNGVWQAAEYSGTFGTNGFHLLDFANESTVGHDSSGNDNDFTANNISTSDGEQFAVYGEVTNSGRSTTNISSLTLLQSNSKRYETGSTAHNLITADFGSVGSYSLFAGPYLSNSSFNGTVAISDNGTSWTSVTKGQSPFTFSGRYIQWARSDSGYGGQTLQTQQVGAGNDVLFDVPTNDTTNTDSGAGGEISGNYCVLNPLDTKLIHSNGNLDATASTSQTWVTGRGTMAMPSGKFYWEVTINSLSTTSDTAVQLGIGALTASLPSNDGAADSNAYVYLNFNGKKMSGGSEASYGASYTTGDVIGVAFNADAGTLVFYKNGSSQGTAYSSLDADKQYAPLISLGRSSTSTSISVNFGQRAWAYSAPSNHVALNTTNRATPTIADGSDYFQTVLWTGNGGTQSITTTGMSPDLVWIKSRSNVEHHSLNDTVRGANKQLESSRNIAETTHSNILTSFDSSGFTLSASDAVNKSSATYVGWCWEAGSSTVSNTDGSITSSVRASQTSGFSVVTFTGTGANATVGHGLNAKPDFYVVKRRSAADDWECYHSALGATYYGKLNATDVWTTSGGTARWNDTEPTSSVFTVGTTDNVNGNGSTYVAYVMSAVAGYSAFGSYTGTGFSDNRAPFIHLGFRAAFVMIKSTTLAHNWVIFDSARGTYNFVDQILWPNRAAVEAAVDTGDTNTGDLDFDILSNGIKLRTANWTVNKGSSDTYIYIAFAENPFQANGGLAR